MTVQVMEKPVLSNAERQALSQLETIQLWHEVSDWASREGEPKELDLAASVNGCWMKWTGPMTQTMQLSLMASVIW